MKNCIAISYKKLLKRYNNELNLHKELDNLEVLKRTTACLISEQCGNTVIKFSTIQIFESTGFAI